MVRAVRPGRPGVARGDRRPGDGSDGLIAGQRRTVLGRPEAGYRDSERPGTADARQPGNSRPRAIGAAGPGNRDGGRRATGMAGAATRQANVGNRRQQGRARRDGGRAATGDGGRPPTGDSRPGNAERLACRDPDSGRLPRDGGRPATRQSGRPAAPGNAGQRTPGAGRCSAARDGPKWRVQGDTPDSGGWKWPFLAWTDCRRGRRGRWWRFPR